MQLATPRICCHDISFRIRLEHVDAHAGMRTHRDLPQIYHTELARTPPYDAPCIARCEQTSGPHAQRHSLCATRSL